ncbi:CIA30 family protein [Thiorhodovibrio frisius]|uniref:Complex I intermediate-associated protein 30 (CIA30) n=1 Tax=Thiorhodovibrio frisius TaxID=631362 RepID=H8Z2Q3_9GAMM|nr:CIA30 family protein [Thiorhodovibrio frisius]EIC22746.1 Complex I intermediate-associated protein 30 (CIA30) [Thiorhodovibrio frisius]WPL22503.1 Complex I intermediate-associated protein 30 (CIA30) [Thiorhodovibrio frisius]
MADERGPSAGLSGDAPEAGLERPAQGWLIDDFRDAGRSQLGTSWRVVSDQVMGGVSSARMHRIQSGDRDALCLEGEVSLENNGGFAQINLDLAADGPLDASDYSGIWLVQRGNGADYSLHLKTSATRLPWQSYRAGFTSTSDWTLVRLPFADFAPYRIDRPLDLARLKRLGLVAIGREMTAELCVAELGFYTETL